MALTINDLGEFVGADATTHATQLQRTLAEAEALVGAFVGTAVVPEAILDRCYLEVGAELWARESAPAPTNSGQYADGGMNLSLRITRDPLNPVYRILRRWVLPF